jgi:hypothetical protein
VKTNKHNFYMGQKIESSVILVCLMAQTISDGTFYIFRQVARRERISRLRTLRYMKSFPKHASNAVFTGKVKTINWIAINLMLKYSDIFLAGCRMTNVVP